MNLSIEAVASVAIAGTAAHAAVAKAVATVAIAGATAHATVAIAATPVAVAGAAAHAAVAKATASKPIVVTAKPHQVCLAVNLEDRRRRSLVMSPVHSPFND